MPAVQTVYDPQNDALRTRYRGAHIAASKEHTLDSDLVISYDHDRRIVGVQLQQVNQIRGMWQVHPARHCLPTELRLEIDHFVEWLESGPMDPETNRQRNVPPRWLIDAVAAA